MGTDKENITQKQSGSNNTQIGVQNNYKGLSPVDATKMAFQIFQEYYPQLRDSVLQELRELVNEKLRQVPAENIIPPKARVVVPVLQNASITEETEIRELYANLLANSMNKVVKNGVHPGFVEIIKQLCPDEAKILKYISKSRQVPVITLRFEDAHSNGIDIVKNFSDIGEMVGCENIFSINAYFDNLIRLGLVAQPAGRHLINSDLYERLKQHGFIVMKTHIAPFYPKYNKVSYVESYIEMTPFGDKFCDICITR